MARVSVVIPVGPEQHHAQWLHEAWDSCMEQTRLPDEIVVVDDMHGRNLDLMVEGWFRDRPETARKMDCSFEEPRWRQGVANAFNWGLATAFSEGADLALCLGADDVLQPRCLEELEVTYRANRHRDGYYWFEIEYQDGTQQGLPCHAAALTPDFFQRTGGYPVEASAGSMDSTLISAMLVHDPTSLIKVDGRNQARYWSRQHEQQESKRLLIYGSATGHIRDAFTQHYCPTTWGRYFDA